MPIRAPGRLMHLPILLAIGFCSLVSVFADTERGIAAQAASAIDCDEFIDQAEAQRFFEVKGGPNYDPYYLDGDNDGVACEPGPPPTPVSQGHAEYCEGFLDYIVDSPPADGGARYRAECADYIEQKRGFQSCPAYQGLNYRFFSALSRDQLGSLSDMQQSELVSVMNFAEGECVPVDVAKSSAWQCQPLPYYIGEFEQGLGQFIGDKSYYTQQLTDRYRVVCLGAEVKLGKSRQFSKEYLGAAALVGAAAFALYTRSRKQSDPMDA